MSEQRRPIINATLTATPWLVLVVGLVTTVSTFVRTQASNSEAQFFLITDAVMNVVLFVVTFIAVRSWRELQTTYDRALQAEVRLRTLIETIPAVTYIDLLTPDGHFDRRDYVSPQIDKLLGYSMEEALKSRDAWGFLIDATDATRYQQTMQQHYQSGQPLDVNFRVRTRFGKPLWLRFLAVRRPLAPDTTQLVSQGVLFDVTPLKQVEDDLRQTTGLLTSVVNVLPDLVLLLSVQGAVIDVLSPSPSHFPAELAPEIGQIVPENLPSAVGAAMLQRLHQVRMQKHVASLEFGLQSRFFEMRLVPFTEGEVIAVVRDVTIARLTTQALQDARSSAEAADRAKSELLAELVVDLATPVATLMVLNQALKQPNSAAEAQVVQAALTSNLQVLNQHAETLLRTELSTDRNVLSSFGPVLLSELVQQAITLCYGQLFGRPVDVIYLPDDDTPGGVILNYGRVRQVLAELVLLSLSRLNQGEVVISVGAQAQKDGQLELHFIVRDNAPTLTPAQLSAQTGSRTAGVLNHFQTARRTVQLMDGELWAEPVTESGQGNLTHLVLPCLEAPQLAQPELTQPNAVLEGRPVLVVAASAHLRYQLVRQVRLWGMRPRAFATLGEARQWLEGGHAGASGQEVLVVDSGLQPDRDPYFGQLLVRQPTVVILANLGRATGTVAGEVLFKPIQPAALLAALTSRVQVQAKASEATPRPTLKATAPAVQPLADVAPLPRSEPRTPLRTDATLGQRNPLRILLAEDNPVNQQVARRMLQRLGYGVTIVGDGQAAVEALKTADYDLVLMDMQMPVMDGLTATAYIREHWPPAAQPRLVAMTAYALQGDREKYLAAGLDDYLSKPVRLDELVAVLERTWVRQAAQVEAVSLGVSDGSRPEGSLLPAVDASLPPTFEPATLRDIQAALAENGPAVVNELLDLFMTDSPQLLETARIGLAEGDLEAVRVSAHTLKSSSASLGALRLSQLSLMLEQAATHNRIEDCASGFEALTVEYAALVDVLSKVRREGL